MIRFIITDLDGTLFYNHGETVFDLSEENIEAIECMKKNNVRLIPCSGRGLPYSLRLYELFELGKPILASGLNAATIYDDEMVEVYELDCNDVLDMIQLVEQYPNMFYNMQAQDPWETRIYYDPNEFPATLYRNAIGKEKCSIVSEIPLKEYVCSGEKICKFSVSSHTPKDSKFIENIVKERYGEKYTVTRSSAVFLEVNHKLANKGKFVQYIKEKYNLTSDEVAVIGDNHNDSFMYTESNHTFAMENGDEDLKASAKYIVKSVAECIEICLEMNEKN